MLSGFVPSFSKARSPIRKIKLTRPNPSLKALTLMGDPFEKANFEKGMAVLCEIVGVGTVRYDSIFK